MTAPFITTISGQGSYEVRVKTASLTEMHTAHDLVLNAFQADSHPQNGMTTRVRQSRNGDWRVDLLRFGFLWLPIGRWIHQDWWAPYDFETVGDALHFANQIRARRAARNGHAPSIAN